jgi:poly-gamma-glutamate capsule biosynthesis protein CapA/YwtB (metallophosphatase superfamily)
MRTTLALLTLIALLATAACLGSGEQSTPTPTAVLLDPTAVTTHTSSPSPTPSPTPGIEPLTLDGIFPPRDLGSLGLDPSRVRTLIATGDVIPARYTDVTIRGLNDDFGYTVAATRDITSDADITVVNLEAPLVAFCPYHDSGFTFCGRPGFIGALAVAGVDVVTLENNHITNYGPQGVAETQDHLDAAGLAWADREDPAIIDVDGVTFGFVAFNGVGEAIDREAMKERISSLAEQVDVVAVSYHWGAEYVTLPATAPGVAPDDPIEIGRLAVDAGADLVIGNHPHWVQGVELYNGGFIAYAHGNFIFDQMWSYETRVGVIGKYTFYDDELIGVDFTPVLIENYAQPVPLTGQERQAVLDTMREASEQMAARAASAP